MSRKGTSVQKLKKQNVSRFNNSSIFNTMERFIRTVREMENTILIPSRLLDLTVGDSQDRFYLECKHGSVIKASLADTDLFHLYNIINEMKVEILRSQDQMNDFQRSEENTALIQQKLKRSLVSTSTPTHSVQRICTCSDLKSDIVIENDCEMENEDGASAVAKSFRRHVRGLYFNIQKMTLIAEYLILRYQTDIDGRT